MSKREKLRQRLRRNPQNRTQQEIETLLRAFGFELDRVRGSHHVYLLNLNGRMHRVVIPFHQNRAKPEYVKVVMQLLDELFPPDVATRSLEGNESDDETD